jgi:hypothetical protein
LPNSSKLTDSREWKKWYASGAVAQQRFPLGALTIEGIANHFAGPGEGHDVLSLGREMVGRGSFRMIYWVVVPSGGNYKLGATLDRLPNNAIPTHIFFQGTH